MTKILFWFCFSKTFRLSTVLYIRKYPLFFLPVLSLLLEDIAVNIYS